MRTAMSLTMALTLLLTPFVIEGKSGGRPAAKKPYVYYTPAPAAYDTDKAFSEGQYSAPELGALYQHWAGVKWYQQQLMPNLPDNAAFAPNTYWPLQKAGVFKSVVELGLKNSIEVAGLRPHNCLANASDLNRSLDGIEEALRRLRDAGGGDAEYVAGDTALHNCGLGAKDTGRRVGWWSRALEERVATRLGRTLPVCLVEAYPEAKRFEHEAYLDEIWKDRREHGYVMLPCYVLDIDLERVRRESSEVILATDVLLLSRKVHAMGMQFGLILIGVDGPSELEYFDGAVDRLGLYDELGFLDPKIVDVDQIFVQSWATRTTTKRQDLPDNTPVGRRTHLDFLLHSIRCFDRLVPCQAYR